MRKTKIICTMGPAVDDEAKLSKMMLAGMDCARFNFSHGTHEEQKVRIDRVRKVSDELNIPIAFLLDTKGPEIRVSCFENGSIVLEKGQVFTLDTDKETLGDNFRVGLTYDKLAKYVEVGGTILIDDGKIGLKVTDIKGSSVICKVSNGGKLSNRKSINLPNMSIPMPYLSEIDKADIRFGIEQGVNFIAASFVRTGDDVKKLRKFLKDNGGSHIQIISKIENGEGVSNLDEIIDLSDGIMVARGDLGVEIAFEKIPSIQKKLISKCNEKGKIVVTATQMLESMTQNPRPTRAEVSDVANAIYDGTTAIMLSGESAAGAYPIEAVKTMAKIAETAESTIDYYTAFQHDHTKMEPNVINAVCASAYSAAEYLDAAAIIVMTRSGRTARTLSSFHPPCPIIAVTIDDIGLHQLKLTWNVTPIAAKELDSPDALLDHALAKAKETKVVKKGDKVIALLASDIRCDNNIMRICIVE